ncbi:sugar transferase [Bosea sp. 124]|uniref:sugar transferase n=1 Tax=Bosea sp. 124 TaxID=2135642 RepID=UPI000D43570E|nr:sugar transferase [Bosea sp. 124]PTM41761.1 lipopolysaccharide/colanic/teichoic acid biosynthesis glycosyltransferase [Bosea sp. 124]
MFRRTYLHLLADLALIGLATVAAFAFRDNVEWLSSRWMAWGTYTALTLVVALIVFTLAGSHRSVYRFANINDYLFLSSLTVVVVLATLLLGFLINRLEDVARTLPILQAILTIMALIVARVGYRLFHARQTSVRAKIDDADHVENVLVIGVDAVADLFIRSVEYLAHGRIRINGVLSPDHQDLRGRRFGTHPVLGVVSEVEAVVAKLRVHGVDIDRIVVAVDEMTMLETDKLLLAAIEANVGVKIDYFAERLGIPKHSQIKRTSATAEEDMLQQPTAPQGFYRYGKRLFDLSLATLLLVVLWPMIVLVSLIVWIDVDRPLLFWQQRPGQGGRPIRIFKFRTMRGAHDDDGNRLADLHRLSATGAILRSRRLDELPQLFNILVGDMSFVGPRPLLPIDQPSDRRDRLRGKPGLTGWAQVMGGRDISPADKASLDAWYIQNMSFLLDIEIMVRTIPMVLFGESVNAEAIRQACAMTGRTPDYQEAREGPSVASPVDRNEAPAAQRINARS